MIVRYKLWSLVFGMALVSQDSVDRSQNYRWETYEIRKPLPQQHRVRCKAQRHRYIMFLLLTSTLLSSHIRDKKKGDITVRLFNYKTFMLQAVQVYCSRKATSSKEWDCRLHDTSCCSRTHFVLPSRYANQIIKLLMKFCSLTCAGVPSISGRGIFSGTIVGCSRPRRHFSLFCSVPSRYQ